MADFAFPEPPLCRFFQRGFCRYGSRCRFSHKDSGAAPNTYLGYHHQPRYWSRPARYNNHYNHSFQRGGGASSSASALGASSSASASATSTSTSAHNVVSFGRHTNSRNKGRQVQVPVEALVQVQGASAVERICAICLDIMLDGVHTKRYGLLPNCNHCFCLPCILHWRKSVDFESSVTQSCPECRTASDFVFPSYNWLDNEAKDKYIQDYRKRLSNIPCRNFRGGRSICPFGAACVYKHEVAEGVQPKTAPAGVSFYNLWDVVDFEDSYLDEEEWMEFMHPDVLELLGIIDGDADDDDEDEGDDDDELDVESLYSYSVPYESDDEYPGDNLLEGLYII